MAAVAAAAAGPVPAAAAAAFAPRLALVLLLLFASSASGALAAPARHLTSNDTGVWHCSMVLPTASLPGLPNKTKLPSFTLHVLLRYTVTTPPNSSRALVKIQGMNVVDVPDPPESPPPPSGLAHQGTSGSLIKHTPFDPPAHEADPQLRLWAALAPPGHAGFKLYTTLSFPLGPVISGFPQYIEGSFSIPTAWGHEFNLTALSGGDGQRCSFQPDAVANQFDPRGIHIDLSAPKANSKAMADEAVVILKPLFNMNPILAAALIDRHIQHYAMLGFTKYVAYLLPRDVQLLMSEPRLIKWVNHGFLTLLKWDMVPEHPGKPLWDQRVVYTHAVLAFLGRNAFLLMSDLDEYMVSLVPGPQTVFEMLRTCTLPTDDLVNLQLTRFNILARDWPDRNASEQPLWLPDTREEHPVMRESLINLKFPPYYKSMVNPNFIKVFFVHVASAYRHFNITRPDPHCMVLAHACNVNFGRENSPARIATRFAEDPAWVAALGRLRLQRQRWLAAGSAAARTSGPLPLELVLQGLQ